MCGLRQQPLRRRRALTSCAPGPMKCSAQTNPSFARCRRGPARRSKAGGGRAWRPRRLSAELVAGGIHSWRSLAGARTKQSVPIRARGSTSSQRASKDSRPSVPREGGLTSRRNSNAACAFVGRTGGWMRRSDPASEDGAHAMQADLILRRRGGGKSSGAWLSQGGTVVAASRAGAGRNVALATSSDPRIAFNCGSTELNCYLQSRRWQSVPPQRAIRGGSMRC